MAIVNKYGLEGKEDFLGFSFNKMHSSEFNIIRVSSSGRYSHELLPNNKLSTLEIDGRDGNLLLDTKKQNKSFSINFAYDYLTETKLRKMKQWLSIKTTGELYFDEDPYKIYYGIVNSIPKINFVCFDEINGERIYKGEGTVQFVCPYPYAICPYKQLKDFKDISNVKELQWGEASGLPIENNNNGVFVNNSAIINNYGDLPVNWRLFFNTSGAVDNKKGSITLSQKQNVIGKLIIDLNSISENRKYCLDSETGLLFLITDEKNIESNFTYLNVSTSFIYAGDFFPLPVGESSMVIDWGSKKLIAEFKPLKFNYEYY